MRPGRTPSAHPLNRARKAALTAVALTLGMLPLMSGVAQAAVTAVDAEPETAVIQLPGSVTITGTYVGTDPEPIVYAVTAGPNVDKAGNGAQADGACTKNALVTPKTFSCAPYTGSTPGTDTIRVFADNNSNNLFDTGEPFDDVTRTWAGPVFSVTMTPDTDQAALGVCNPFTVTLRDSGGNPNPAAPFNVILDPQSATQKVDFCTPAPTGAAQAAPTTGNGANALATFTTNNAGQFTFGVNADTPGVIDVRAYSDTNTSNAFDAGEPTDTSVKTFVAGGSEAVTTLVAAPKTDTNFTGEVHVITATLTNASGDAIAGVTPSFDVTAGPNAAAVAKTACTASNQSGVSTCSYTGGTTAGTDTIVVWVDKAAGATAGPDANEPQDTVQKTWVASPTGLAIVLSCVGTSANTNTKNCINPIDDNNEVFTAKVTNATSGAVAPGILVRFTLPGLPTTGSTADTTVVPAECTTATNGTCSTTLTNPNPVAGDSVAITATIAGTSTSDSGSKTWQARAASLVKVTPALATNQTGTAHTVTAKVTDQFGTAVVGANVDFTVAGRNTSGTTGFDRTTDASGNATFTYTDTGATSASGTDTITVVADVVTENDVQDGAEPFGTATKRWIPEATTPAAVEVDMVGCNADFGPSPTYTPLFNESTATNQLSTTNFHTVCAIVRTAGGDRLLGSTVTFTSTGVGHFSSVGSSPHTDLGTSTTATVGTDGYARVFLHSTQTGTQTITATAGTRTDTGTKTWTNTATDARNIDVSPNAATNPPGTSHTITARVTDLYGNPVAGVAVTFTETGPGRFANGTSTSVTTTDANGLADAVTSTLTTESGTETIVGTITTIGTQCTSAAGTPAGSTAGNCSETVIKVWSTTGGPTAAPSTYFPVTPARIFDTRNGTGTTTAKMGPASTRTVDVTGFGGVPATGASAVVVNLTITEGSANTYLSVTPNGGNATSSLNVVAGETRANLVKVAIGPDGNIRVFNALGNADVIMDVFGYYSDTLPGGSRLNSLTPARIVDTRTASTVGTFTPAGKLGAGASAEKTVNVTGVGGVPTTGVTAVVLTTTVTEGTAPSFLAVTPNGFTGTSNINFGGNQDVPNLVVVPVGADGKVRVYNGAGQVNFIFDVVGWYGAADAATGDLFTPLDPQRILDTRTGVGTFLPPGKLGAGAANQKTVKVTGIGGVPAIGVKSVVVNLTGTEGTAATFLSVTPGGGGATSNLNLPGGQDKAVLVVVPVDATGSVKVFNAVGSIHVLFDVVGYFAA